MTLSSPTTIATGFRWVEGPLWVPRLGALLVSDLETNTIWQVEPTGEAWRRSVFLRPSGFAGPHPPGVEHGSNGLALDADGRIVMCSHGERGVFVLDEQRWTKRPLALGVGGLRFNSPNDLARHPSGAFFVTDPPYGLALAFDDPRRELDVCGVYRVDPGTGAVTLATDAVEAPNGIALSPDGETAYVSCSDPEDARRWMAFDVHDDGTLRRGRVLLDASSFDGAGGPDGLAVWTDGTVVGAAPGGLVVFSAEGDLRDHIAVDGVVSNVAFGQDCRALFATGADRVLRFEVR